MERLDFDNRLDDIVAKLKEIELRPKKFEGKQFCVKGKLSKTTEDLPLENLLALRLSLADTEIRSLQINAETSFTVYLQTDIKEQLKSYEGGSIKLVFKVVYGMKEILSSGLFITEDLIGYEVIGIKGLFPECE